MATRKTVGIKEICAAFGITLMTLHNWRKDPRSTKDPFPPQAPDGLGVRWYQSDVVKWGKAQGLTMNFVDVENNSKPGPKPRVIPAKKKAFAKSKIGEKLFP
jgi:predicted DNA-binding transcriptional regulator AlpA